MPEKRAGSTRVSRIAIKTASERQGLLVVVALVMFFVMGVIIALLCPADQRLGLLAVDINKQDVVFNPCLDGSLETP